MLSQKLDGCALGLDEVSGLSFLEEIMSREAQGSRWAPNMESCELITIICVAHGIFSQIL